MYDGHLAEFGVWVCVEVSSYVGLYGDEDVYNDKEVEFLYYVWSRAYEIKWKHEWYTFIELYRNVWNKWKNARYFLM